MGSTNQPTPTIWHVVLRRPLTELKWWSDYVKEVSQDYLIGEHNADLDDKVTHCHTMLVNCNITIEALRKNIKKNGLTGSEDYAIMTVTHKKKIPYNLQLAVYILKGDNETFIVTSYDIKQINEWVENWKNYSHRAEPINDGEKKEKFDNYKELLQEFETNYPMKNRPSLDHIRTWVMKWHWKKFRRMPNPSAYKRDASSLFMVHTESYSGACVETAYEEIKMWCY
ncbi:replication-associated protein [Chicken proventriculitis-associated circular virus 9]|nr:replication-associated protein [Chicken proventriculitis-associated circular virus 9]